MKRINLSPKTMMSNINPHSEFIADGNLQASIANIDSKDQRLSPTNLRTSTQSLNEALNRNRPYQDQGRGSLMTSNASADISSTSNESKASSADDWPPSHKKPARKSLRKMNLPFPWKLHTLLNDLERDGRQDIASWSPRGDSFRVHKPDVFSKDVLCNYFRQKKFNSFTRQLYVYGFAKVESGPGAGGFYHPSFLRNSKPEALILGRNESEKDRRCKPKTKEETEDSVGKFDSATASSKILLDKKSMLPSLPDSLAATSAVAGRKVGAPSPSPVPAYLFDISPTPAPMLPPASSHMLPPIASGVDPLNQRSDPRGNEPSMFNTMSRSRLEPHSFGARPLHDSGNTQQYRETSPTSNNSSVSRNAVPRPSFSQSLPNNQREEPSTQNSTNTHDLLFGDDLDWLEYSSSIEEVDDSIFLNETP